MHRPLLGWAILALAGVFAGCGGGAASTGSPGGGHAGLVASPASIANLATAQVLVTGIQGTATISVGDQRLIDVSSPVVNGNAIAFSLTEVAGGSTTVTVSDATGASVTIPVSNLLCLPPQPNITLIGEQIAHAMPTPPPGQPQSPLTVSYLFFAVPSTSFTGAGVYSTRLIGSDRSIVKGASLELTNQPGSPQIPSPPPVPSGQVELDSAVSALPAGITYSVQLVGRGCEPAFIVGSFST